MPPADRSLRSELERRLLALGGKMPTSALGRLGRTAMAGLRGGRLALRGKAGDGELDLEALVALVASVGELKGVAMKAGQLLSYLDLPVPAELRSAFSALQTHSPPMPFERVREIVRGELGNEAAPLLAHMDPAPAAAASIGQVHRARLPDGVEVAVKVQYPEIEKAILSHFRSAAVGSTFAGLFAAGADVDAVIGAARRALLDECDYAREADYQERFARVYAGHPMLLVPAVHRRYGARRVLTTSWMDGLRFDAFLLTDPPDAERNRLGEALFEFYVGTLFRHGIYNWDPHPGNYVFLPDGRIAMLDYGSTREFDRAFVGKVVALTRAVHTDTREAWHEALVGLRMVREGEAYDFATARSFIRSFFGPMLKDEVLLMEPGVASSMRAILDNKRKLLKLHIPGDLLFLFRIRFGVMSVLARLGARANWYRLERRFSESDLVPVE